MLEGLLTIAHFGGLPAAPPPSEVVRAKSSPWDNKGTPNPLSKTDHHPQAWLPFRPEQQLAGDRFNNENCGPR